MGALSYESSASNRGLPKCCFLVVTRIPTRTADMSLGEILCWLSGFALGVWWFRFPCDSRRWVIWWCRCIILCFCMRELWISGGPGHEANEGGHHLPLWARNFDWLIPLDVTSLSDSEPSVSYSVIGIWRVRILRTSLSVEPGLSDSMNCMSKWNGFDRKVFNGIVLNELFFILLHFNGTHLDSRMLGPSAGRPSAGLCCIRAPYSRRNRKTIRWKCIIYASFA